MGIEFCFLIKYAICLFAMFEFWTTIYIEYIILKINIIKFYNVVIVYLV